MFNLFKKIRNWLVTPKQVTSVQSERNQLDIDQLEKCKLAHKTMPKWQGEGTMQYVDLIKENIDKYHCQTMLDYGCGKGIQYTQFNLHKQLGLELKNIFQFDPAHEPVATEPDWNQTFDCSICLDVLHFVTESELDIIKSKLEKSTTKICIIGIQLDPPKSKSLALKPYALLKPANWWQDKFSSWNSSSRLILELRDNIRT